MKVGDLVKYIGDFEGVGKIVYISLDPWDQSRDYLVELEDFYEGHEGTMTGAPEGICKECQGWWAMEDELELLE